MPGILATSRSEPLGQIEALRVQMRRFYTVGARFNAGQLWLYSLFEFRRPGR